MIGPHRQDWSAGDRPDYLVGAEAFRVWNCAFYRLMRIEGTRFSVLRDGECVGRFDLVQADPWPVKENEALTQAMKRDKLLEYAVNRVGWAIAGREP